MRRAFISLTIVVCMSAQLALGQGRPLDPDRDWPQFRGPGARGVADKASFPRQWSASRNVAWKRDLSGRGWSCPVVVGDRVFLTTVVNDGPSEEAKKGLYFGGDRLKPPSDEHRWQVLCLSLKTGETLWEHTVHTATPATPRHIKNTYASETPVTDGELVFFLFGDVGVYAYTLDGKGVWSKTFPPVPMRFGWGTAASPALHQDRLYIVNDNEKESTLTAYDRKTGAEAWRVRRNERSNWATPYIWENTLRTEIITPGTGKTRSYDLTGKLLYEFGGFSSITIATPFADGGLLYVSSGYVLDPRKPIYALRPGASGDITLSADQSANTGIAWSQKQAAPYNPTTLVYRGVLYVLHDRGLLAGYDSKTGELLFDRQRIPNGGGYTASPWAADGHVYCVNEDGVTAVFQAGRTYRFLHANRLADDDMCMATPAIAGDQLLIRTAKRIYCIAKGKE